MWGLAAALSIMVSAQANFGLVGADRPVLHIWIGNQTTVPLAVLAAAKENVETLLRAADVQVLWTENPAQTPHVLVALIAPEERAKYLKVRDPEALGATFRADDGPGGTVYVLFERVVRAASSHRTDTALVLAYALAHEIGHALLRRGHATAGIMRAAWEDQEFRLMRGCDLRFSSREAADIRRALESR
jgi:hypothetical protein